MPEPRPERNPGETLSAYTERLQEWAAQQNAPPPANTPGAANAQKPAGTEVSPGRIVSPNLLTTYLYNPTSGWTPSAYPPSADDKRAAGGSSGTSGTRTSSGGTSTTNYAVQNAQQKGALQEAGGGIRTPPDTWYVNSAGARAVDPVSKMVYTKDPVTQVWTTYGQVYNPRGSDALWVTQAARDKVQGVGPASNPSTPATAMRPIDPLATPLNPNQGPTFNSPLFSQGFRAGAMPTFQEGMIRGGNAATNALNALTVQSRSMQGNGPVVQGAASMGNGRGNIEFTRGGQGTSRTVAADRQFDPISFYVPGSYNPQTSRDNDGVFRPVDVAYNIASPTLDPLAGGGLNTGGAAYMTLSGPQTAHINDMSTGFNPNAMAHSNIGLAYGRDFSGLDSVSQMVATAALMNDREQLAALGYGPLAAMEAMTAASPSTWEGDGPGFRGFSRGGTVIALDPLGGTRRYANGGSMVTSGPMGLVDLRTGDLKAIMGEDNADRDRLPDRELLRFSGPANSRLDITPLDPPRTFAEGGVVQARTPYINPQGVIQDFDAAIDFPDGPGDWTPYTAPTPTVTNPVAPTPTTPVTNPVAPTPTATTPTALPIDPGGVYLNPTSPTAPLIDPLTGQSGYGADDPAGGFEGTPSPADEFVDPPATVPVGAPRPIDPLANFDVNNPNILAPWQKAAQDLAVMAHRRRTIDDPRRRAGGMGASTGLEVLQGDVPATGLPPGMFYDPSGQVTRVISDIIGSQDALRALGPEEDVSPAYEAVTSIGNALDDMARIRQLEDARVAATAEATAEQLYASNAALDLWGQLQDLGGLLEQMKQAMGPNSNPLQRPDPAEMQALQGKYNAMLNAYNSASLTAGTPLGDAQGNIRLATIDAQLASIRGRLPVGKNEASLRTDLAREQLKIAKNDKRIGLKQQVANLAKVGVPSLSAPIKPLDPLAA